MSKVEGDNEEEEDEKNAGKKDAKFKAVKNVPQFFDADENKVMIFFFKFNSLISHRLPTHIHKLNRLFCIQKHN